MSNKAVELVEGLGQGPGFEAMLEELLLVTKAVKDDKVDSQDLEADCFMYRC
jgi:hypothetical protein